MSNNGISHVKVAPYYPSSNGFAERAVKILKRNIECQTTGRFKTKLGRFLFDYKTTSHSATTTSPASLLTGQKLKTCLDLLHPDITDLQRKVEWSIQKREWSIQKRKDSYDQHARV